MQLHSPPQLVAVADHPAPLLVMSQRAIDGKCKGCEDCIHSISVVGVMIYDQIIPNLQLEDNIQQLKSVCITRTLKSCNSGTSDIVTLARDLINDRLPAGGGNIPINPNAYLDTPVDQGNHVQRCYLVPKSSAAEMSDDGGDDRIAINVTGHA
jgi:hypothetical protein